MRQCPREYMFPTPTGWSGTVLWWVASATLGASAGLVLFSGKFIYQGASGSGIGGCSGNCCAALLLSCGIGSSSGSINLNLSLNGVISKNIPGVENFFKNFRTSLFCKTLFMQNNRVPIRLMQIHIYI